MVLQLFSVSMAQSGWTFQGSWTFRVVLLHTICSLLVLHVSTPGPKSLLSISWKEISPCVCLEKGRRKSQLFQPCARRRPWHPIYSTPSYCGEGMSISIVQMGKLTHRRTLDPCLSSCSWRKESWVSQSVLNPHVQKFSTMCDACCKLRPPWLSREKQVDRELSQLLRPYAPMRSQTLFIKRSFWDFLL